MHLEIRDKPQVELNKPDKFGHIAYDNRRRPELKQLVFQHGWVVALWSNVNPGKLKTLQENMQLLEAQGEVLGLHHSELALLV
jgi:hypothetical protein